MTDRGWMQMQVIIEKASLEYKDGNTEFVEKVASETGKSGAFDTPIVALKFISILL
jgi:hypothetical protein